MPEGSRLTLGGVAFEVRDGVAQLLDGSAFGGSTTLQGKMLPILRNVVGVPMAEAVRMCSLTPACVAGWGDRIGSIAPGKLADMVVWDENLAVQRVMIGGAWMEA
jgi:N-acetylglucosamine-6-phosphate deacetylase